MKLAFITSFTILVGVMCYAFIFGGNVFTILIALFSGLATGGVGVTILMEKTLK